MQLEALYPGINSDSFLRDVLDILRHQSGVSLLDLNQSSAGLSFSSRKTLEDQFLVGKPLAVLMGFGEFYHSRFYVNENVLIPRPETEYLVDLIVRELRGKVKRILDVGTGSGVIALSLLRHGVGETGLATDLSEEALEVARINARRFRLQDKLKFLQTDRLTSIGGKFNLIVSNPPYIKKQSHRSLVHASVDEHEPHLALYLDDQEYGEWFELFFRQIGDCLCGVFFMEGHENEVDSQAEILKRLGFHGVEVLTDLAGHPRFLRAHKR